MCCVFLSADFRVRMFSGAAQTEETPKWSCWDARNPARSRNAQAASRPHASIGRLG
jgi:hypothetical protein